ncbi:serine O-acetyltransferase [Arenimonas sp.]|uniref:serine O-acetyltransferase n=1 Tax=Arenimonas sp. TaxID=1872635 RepID=UPI0035B09FBA
MVFALIKADHSRFVACGSHPNTILGLFLFNLEFRSVFFYRVGSERTASRILHRLYPPLPSLHLGMRSCGPGLYIEHGFATIVTDVAMGKNCWINQQVTIGTTDKGSPTIGDNVRVCAGAIVVGPVSIGNGVTVGAGAVVAKSVPDDCVVVGNPAYILKRNGLRVNEKL